jgi:hypothetical protein
MNVAALTLAACLAAASTVCRSDAPAARASVEPGIAAHRVSTATFVDASRPTRCAEEDNVHVQMFGKGITRFRILAEHPPYAGAIVEDSTAPDFSHCDMSGDPRFTFAPRTLVLYEDAHIRLVGHTFASFWRPEVVGFEVGGRTEHGLHLVQLLRRLPKRDARHPARDVEILVVYPSDGYWRPKPLPPPALADSAYGSSFLFGPIEVDGRPLVRIRHIAFDPAALRFVLAFRDGSNGALTVAGATHERLTLDLSLDPPGTAGRAFAALRSMFVTPEQSDVAIAHWQPVAGDAVTRPILGFDRFDAPAARFGRVVPSRHNLSAPDLVFDAFETTPAR